MNQITKIGEAILAVISSWSPAATIVENIINCVSALVAAAPEAGILQGAMLKDVTKVEASMTAINAGDVAILGTVPLEGKNIAIFAIDNSSLLATKLFGTGAAPTP